MSEKPKTTEAEELQRIVELIEDVTVTEPDERMMIMMLASLMTGSCSEVQQVSTTINTEKKQKNENSRQWVKNPEMAGFKSLG